MSHSFLKSISLIVVSLASTVFAGCAVEGSDEVDLGGEELSEEGQENIGDAASALYTADFRSTVLVGSRHWRWVHYASPIGAPTESAATVNTRAARNENTAFPSPRGAWTCTEVTAYYDCEHRTAWNRQAFLCATGSIGLGYSIHEGGVPGGTTRMRVASPTGGVENAMKPVCTGQSVASRTEQGWSDNYVYATGYDMNRVRFAFQRSGSGRCPAGYTTRLDINNPDDPDAWSDNAFCFMP